MTLASKRLVLFGVILLLTTGANAQFAPAAGMPGSTAIWKDSSVFVAWANSCTIQRGLMDIAISDSGYASVGDGNSATGMAGQNGVVSLGDGGVATLSFSPPIYNGPGFDFAVFENGFYTAAPLAFLEFAFVEVSSDGNNFFRFPATSNIEDSTQIPMTGVDCSLVNNLAGKYVFGYGTPFDLDELSNEPGLDVSHIKHVRLIDVVGSIDSQYATHDQYGHKINDPYPTPFPSGGFDLDAVGVIHSSGATSINEATASTDEIRLFPNPSPANAPIIVEATESMRGEKLEVFDVNGKRVTEQTIELPQTFLKMPALEKGIYFLSTGDCRKKFIVK